jgi:hypothetical protein
VGALHRVSPFLMRTRGDAGTIRRSAKLTTRSEGGDCHMGRALLGSSTTQDRVHLAGAACALVSKNETTAIAECDALAERRLTAMSERDGRRRASPARAAPLGPRAATATSTIVVVPSRPIFPFGQRFLHDVFLSHAWGKADAAGAFPTKEKAVAVLETLQKDKLRVWFDTNELHAAATSFDNILYDAIDESAVFVLCVNDDYALSGEPRARAPRRRGARSLTPPPPPPQQTASSRSTTPSSAASPFAS